MENLLPLALPRPARWCRSFTVAQIEAKIYLSNLLVKYIFTQIENAIEWLTPAIETPPTPADGQAASGGKNKEKNRMKLNWPDTTKGIGALLKGLLWATVAGAGTGAWQAAYNYFNFSDPVDWKGIERAAMAGAFLGASAWFKTHQALWTPPPGTAAVPLEASSLEAKPQPPKVS